MKKVLYLLVCATVVVAGCQKKNAYVHNKAKTEMDSVSYAYGILLAQNFLGNLDSTANIDMIAKGIYDVRHNEKLLFGGDTIMVVMMKHFDPKGYAMYMENVEKEKKFMAENAKKSGVKTTPSGLQYEVITQGTGAKPEMGNTVKVTYVGTLLDGSVFDSSLNRITPAALVVKEGKAIPGWVEGMQLMTVGSKYKFYIPGKLAYGVQGNPKGGIEPNQTLIFEVELLDIDTSQPQMSQEEFQQMMQQAMQNQGK